MAITVEEAEYVGTPDTIDVASDALPSPKGGLRIVPLDGTAIDIKCGKVALRSSVALVRSLHEPPRRLGIVLRHGLAVMVKVAQDSLRYWIPLRGHGGAKLGRPGLPWRPRPDSTHCPRPTPDSRAATGRRQRQGRPLE